MKSYAGQQILGGMGYRFATFTVSQNLIDAQGKDKVVEMCRQSDNVPENALLQEQPLVQVRGGSFPCPPEEATHWRWEFVWVDGEQK